MATASERMNRVFVVEGANWKVRVPMDNDDMDMDFNEQLAEAATKGVEAFFGHIDNDSFSIPLPENPPLIGTAVCVYDEVDEKNEERYFFIPSFIPLANAGHYKESAEVLRVLQEQEHEEQTKLLKAIGGPEKLEQLQLEANKLIQKEKASGKKITDATLQRISKQVMKKIKVTKQIKAPKKPAGKTVKKARKKKK